MGERTNANIKESKPKCPKSRARHRAYIAGLRKVWRNITKSKVLTQEEIPEESK